MSTTPDAPPVDKLLTLGEPEPLEPDRWPNYLELGLGPEHIPDLMRMATDHEIRSIEPKEGEEVEALSLIERAFAADRVDEFVVSLDDVLVEFGLKEREEIQVPEPFRQLFERLESPPSPDQIAITPPDTPQIRPPAQKTTAKPIKFSGKRITKKRRKKR